MDTNNWYVLYISPRAEKKVKTRLDEQGVENYLPLHRSPSVWSDRIKMVDKPLFNSYIFVRCKEYELRPLLLVYGVVRIVYYNGKPAVVRQKDIDAICQFLEEVAEHPLCEGDEVEILTGALKNISGKVRKIQRNYLLLFIEQLGTSVAVNLSRVARVNRIR